jgi:5-methylcytosine-specific restriction endonuclease McrA
MCARREYNRAWYLKNRDRVLRKKVRERESWTPEEKSHVSQVLKDWRSTEQGRLACRRHERTRRAKKYAAEGSFTAEDIKNLYATQGGRCYYCSIEIEEGYHIEHMTPLSRGGRNDVSNICLACAPCNLKKHTKTAEEFLSAG